MTKQILIVVDVQRAYSPHFSEDYVEKVQTIVENGNWDEIIIRFVGDDEYTVTEQESEHKSHHTFYEDSRYIPPFLNKKEYKFSERWFGYELDEDNEQTEVVSGKIYHVKDDGGWYMCESPNGDWYCPTREIENLLGKEAEITIIGGFKKQCVKEVQDFLELMGEKVNVLDEYCFNEDEPDIQRALAFTKDWDEPQKEKTEEEVFA